ACTGGWPVFGVSSCNNMRCGLGLFFTSDKQPHSLGPSNRGQRQRQTLGWWLRAIVNSNHNVFLFAHRFGMREQGVDVAFAAHAEQVQVESLRCEFAQLFFIS